MVPDGAAGSASGELAPTWRGGKACPWSPNAEQGSAKRESSKLPTNAARSVNEAPNGMLCGEEAIEPSSASTDL